MICINKSYDLSNFIYAVPFSSRIIGELHPDEIDLPGIYVQKIIKGESYEKRIEKLTLGEASDSGTGLNTNPARDRIVRRAAREFKDGMYVNLGKKKKNSVRLQSFTARIYS